MTTNEINITELVRRILALRKEKKIGIVLVEQDRWWVCADELDPHGTAVPYSLERLVELVTMLEGGRKPVQSAGSNTWSGIEKKLLKKY